MVEELSPTLSVVVGFVIKMLQQAFITRQWVGFPKVVGEKVLAQPVDKFPAVVFCGRQVIQALYRIFKLTPQNFKCQLDRSVEADIAIKSIPPNSFIPLQENDFSLPGSPVLIEGAGCRRPCRDSFPARPGSCAAS
ncbi:MAG: hypothetical protein ACD_74C00160G0001, partial [uncultured bacterium]